MSVFDIIDTGIKKIQSFKQDYTKVIKGFNEIKDIEDTSNLTKEQKQAYKDVGEGIKNISSPVVNKLRPVVNKLKTTVDGVGTKAKEFENGIAQYHQIKDLEKKSFVDLKPKEQETYKNFLSTAKNYGNTYSKLRRESNFTVMKPTIDSDQKSTIIGIGIKQAQYEKYKDNIINKIYGESTGTNISGQTFAQIFDKGMTGERTGNENIAERLTYGAAGILGQTAKIFYDNTNPYDENETAYNIWNNSQLSNFDKITKTAENIAEKLQLDIPLSWQGIDQDKLEASKQKHFDDASLKIGKNLSELTNANGISDIAGKTGGVLAGYVDFFMAPVLPFFEEEVTGKTMENIGTILSLPFQALSTATSESLQALGADKETADNWGLVAATVGPAAIRSGKTPSKVVKDISAETAFIAGLPKEYQKMYVDTKGQVHKMQNFETKLNTETAFTELKSFGVIPTGKYARTTMPGEGISNTIPKSKEFITALKDRDFAKASEIKLELDNTYSILKDQVDNIPKYKWDSKRASVKPLGLEKAIFEGINLGVKGLENVNKNLTDLILNSSVKDLASSALKSSIAQAVAKNTQELGLSMDEMDIVTNNILDILQEKKTNIEQTIKDLNNHIANKENAKESIDYGELTAEEFKNKFTDNVGDLDKGLSENRTEFNYIKTLEDNGVLKEVSKIETDTGIQRVYQSTDYDLNITYPENLAKIFESSNKIADNYKMDQQELLDFEMEINQTDYKTQLEKNFKKSGISAEGFIKKEIDRVLQNRGELAKIEMEIEASKPGERIYLERDIGSGRDVVASPSTFPKWIPEELRNKKLMTSTWEKLTRGDLDIPAKNVKQQKMMSIYLGRLGSELKDIYNVDLKALTKDKDLQNIQVLKERLKNSKAFSRAYYNEYKKVNRAVGILQDRIANLKEGASETKQKLQAQIAKLKDAYTNRKTIVSNIQKEYGLTDIEFDKILKTKNYLKFDEYAFKDFAYKLEAAAYKTAELKYERLYTEQKIREKELSNIENVFASYELPSSISKMSLEDLTKLDEIISGTEKGDIFIGKTLMKRFSIVEEGKGIATVRQVLNELDIDIPGIKERLGPIDNLTLDMYNGAISEIETQIGEIRNSLKSTDSAEMQLKLKNEIESLEADKINLTKDLQNVSEAIAQKKINYKDKKDKTTNEIVTEQKYSKGSWADKYMYDTALAGKDLYFKFLVGLYYQKRIKYDKRIIEIEEKLSPLLKASRNSNKRTIGDRLVPTDDIVIKYIEATSDKKTDMILKGELTKENLELANFVQDLLSEIGNELRIREVLDKLLNNYLTHMNPGILQKIKYKGIYEGVKEIFKKEDHVFDFGALGERDQVLGYQKFFRFSLERKGMQQYNMDLGKIIMGYTKTFYKKLTLDEVIPKAVLYGNVLGDSGTQKTIKSWINNKKGIQFDDLQGTGLDKVVSGLNFFVVLKDLGGNAAAVGFSMVGAFGANLALLGEKNFLIGQQRKYTSQGRSILKNLEGTLGRNPIWNMNKDLFQRPDITPLEMPVHLMFAGLGQVFKSRLNTSFLGMITKEEFKTGVISDKRVREIILEAGKFHSLPGSKSIMGSTLAGKIFMTYKGWRVPLATTTYKLAKRLSPTKLGLNPIDGFKSSQSYKEGTAYKDAATLVRLYGYSFAVMYTIYTNYKDDEDQGMVEFFSNLPYVYKRFFNEAASASSAINPLTWLARPRLAGFLTDFFIYIGEAITKSEYEASKEGEYEKGDLKWIIHMKKLVTPGMTKQFKQLQEILDQGEDTKTSTKSTGKKIKRKPKY